MQLAVAAKVHFAYSRVYQEGMERKVTLERFNSDELQNISRRVWHSGPLGDVHRSISIWLVRTERLSYPLNDLASMSSPA